MGTGLQALLTPCYHIFFNSATLLIGGINIMFTEQRESRIYGLYTVTLTLIEYFYRMQLISFELVDASSSFDTVLNMNCGVDAFNVIYLSGSSLVFHNTFQNSKQFVERAVMQPVKAMAHLSNSESTMALLSFDKDTTFIELYTASSSKAFPLTRPIHALDMVFVDKARLLVLAHHHLSIVHLNTPLHDATIIHHDSTNAFVRIILSERRIFILLERGIMEFDTEEETLGSVMYGDRQLVDYMRIEDEYEVLGMEREVQLCSEDGSSKTIALPRALQRMVRSGRHLLFATKEEVSLLHYVLEDGTLEQVNDFYYSERGVVTSMELSSDEMVLALSLSTNKRVEVVLFNMSVLSSEKKFVEAYRRMYNVETMNVVSLQGTLCDSVCYLAGQNVVEWGAEKRSYALHEHARQLLAHPLGYQYVCVYEAHVKFYQKVESEIIEVWSENMFCTAAKYTPTGMLLLALAEDDACNVILYDPSAFRRLRTVVALTLKHAVVRVDVDEREREVAVYSARDLFIHKLKSGEKVGEFRGKSEAAELDIIVYEWERRQVLAAGKRRLLVCRKAEDCCLHYNQQKLIELPEDVSCLRVHDGTLFLGLASGKLLYTSYPPLIDEHTTALLDYRTFRVHKNPITDIQGSARMLFVGVSNGGVGLLRIHRSTPSHSSPLAAYDFLQSSSKLHLECLEERLKILVEKRKTVFNELEELKKECELRRQHLVKDTTNANKKKELTAIKHSLELIDAAKKKRDFLAGKLTELCSGSHAEQQSSEEATNQALLALYQLNDQLKEKKERTVARCTAERMRIEAKCRDHVKEIKEALESKYRHYEHNNTLIISNVRNLIKRKAIEEAEDESLLSEEDRREEQFLRNKERELIHENNEMKSEIARRRKELQRLKSREDFLENKERFFREEIKQNEREKGELEDAKEDLEHELSVMEEVTLKKERRLKKYFVENNVLQKYQSIHNHLMEASTRELQFLEGQREWLAANIIKIQREISEVAEQKERTEKTIKQRKEELSLCAQTNTSLKQRAKYALYMRQQLQSEIEQCESSAAFVHIHRKYFEDKHLDAFVSANEDGVEANDEINELNRKNQLKIKDVLESHQTYLKDNMQLFENHNAQVNEEIVLHHMKYQTQNYDLIAECNEKKEETVQKKKVMNDLVDRVRETAKIIQKMGKGEQSLRRGGSNPHTKSSSSVRKETQCSTPFLLYEKEKCLGKSRSDARLPKRHVRRMLQVQKMASRGESGKTPLRRIQTAKQPCNELVMSVHCPPDSVHCEGQKPMTAYAQRRRVIYRKENNEKNTTCPSQSKHSTFI